MFFCTPRNSRFKLSKTLSRYGTYFLFWALVIVELVPLVYVASNPVQPPLVFTQDNNHFLYVQSRINGLSAEINQAQKYLLLHKNDLKSSNPPVIRAYYSVLRHADTLRLELKKLQKEYPELLKQQCSALKLADQLRHLSSNKSNAMLKVVHEQTKDPCQVALKTNNSELINTPQVFHLHDFF